MQIDLTSILWNLLSNAIFAVLVLIWTKTRSWFARRLPSLTLPFFVIVLTAWCFLYALVLRTLTTWHYSEFTILVVTLLFAVLLVALTWIECGSARLVGIVHVDRRVADGLSYGKALAQCRNRLRFLGLGASKLTGNPEFEKALLRCTHEEPVDFLLHEPSDTLLEKAAQRAKKDRDEYRRLVRGSLRVLREMRDNRGVNIRVRFYRELPIFRLMFIDDSMCLVSYYVLGEGDGSQLPQMRLTSNPLRRRTIDSFYYAFDAHYDRIWRSSEEWDFKQYVEMTDEKA